MEHGRGKNAVKTKKATLQKATKKTYHKIKQERELGCTYGTLTEKKERNPVKNRNNNQKQREKEKKRQKGSQDTNSKGVKSSLV